MTPNRMSYLPIFAHFVLVLIAGIWLPAPIVAWFQNVAGIAGMTMLERSHRQGTDDRAITGRGRARSSAPMSGALAQRGLANGDLSLLGLWGDGVDGPHGAAG